MENQCIKRFKFAKDYEDFGDNEWTWVLFSDKMGIQISSNDGKVWVQRMKREEYYINHIESIFIFGFRRIKIQGAIRYEKKSKLVIINEDLEKDYKFNIKAYLNEILYKKFFDFWMEAIEDCEYVYMMEDGSSSHQSIASIRKKELVEFG